MNKVMVFIVVSMLTACKFETPEGDCIGFDDQPAQGIKYELSTQNVVWTFIGSETIVAPIVWVLECAKCPVEKENK